MTEEEKQEIIDKAVEKALLLLPEVVGKLMTQHLALSKINTKFYSDYPEFKDKKNIVASVIEKIEGSNPFAKYEDILNMAVPEIRKRVIAVENLNIDKPSPPLDRNFTGVDFSGNGEL